METVASAPDSVGERRTKFLDMKSKFSQAASAVLLVALTTVAGVACTETAKLAPQSPPSRSTGPSTTVPSGVVRERVVADLFAAEDDLVSDAQRFALKDQELSRVEYLQGFERYRKCLSGAGYSLLDVAESGKFVDYSVPSDAVDSGKDEFCNRSEFRYIDGIWQATHR